MRIFVVLIFSLIICCSVGKIIDFSGSYERGKLYDWKFSSLTKSIYLNIQPIFEGVKRTNESFFYHLELTSINGTLFHHTSHDLTFEIVDIAERHIGEGETFTLSFMILENSTIEELTFWGMMLPVTEKDVVNEPITANFEVQVGLDSNNTIEHYFLPRLQYFTIKVDSDEVIEFSILCNGLETFCKEKVWYDKLIKSKTMVMAVPYEHYDHIDLSFRVENPELKKVNVNIQVSMKIGIFEPHNEDDSTVFLRDINIPSDQYFDYPITRRSECIFWSFGEESIVDVIEKTTKRTIMNVDSSLDNYNRGKAINLDRDEEYLFRITDRTGDIMSIDYGVMTGMYPCRRKSNGYTKENQNSNDKETSTFEFSKSFQNVTFEPHEIYKFYFPPDLSEVRWNINTSINALKLSILDTENNTVYSPDPIRKEMKGSYKVPDHGGEEDNNLLCMTIQNVDPGKTCHLYTVDLEGTIRFEFENKKEDEKKEIRFYIILGASLFGAFVAFIVLICFIIFCSLPYVKCCPWFRKTNKFVERKQERKGLLSTNNEVGEKVQSASMIGGKDNDNDDDDGKMRSKDFEEVTELDVVSLCFVCKFFFEKFKEFVRGDNENESHSGKVGYEIIDSI